MLHERAIFKEQKQLTSPLEMEEIVLPTQTDSESDELCPNKPNSG